LVIIARTDAIAVQVPEAMRRSRPMLSQGDALSLKHAVTADAGDRPRPSRHKIANIVEGGHTQSSGQRLKAMGFASRSTPNMVLRSTSRLSEKLAHLREAAIEAILRDDNHGRACQITRKQA